MVAQALDLSFLEYFEDVIGRYHFCRFVQDIQPLHGNILLQCCRYKYSPNEKRQIAEDLLNNFVNVVTELWSGEDPDTLLEAYEAGTKAVGKPGKKSLLITG